MSEGFHLQEYGIDVEDVVRNAVPAVLYQEAMAYEKGAAIASSGALIVRSGDKTGRSPTDKRIVRHPDSEDDIWWGSVNVDVDENTFEINRERAVDFLNSLERLYVVDGFAGWNPDELPERARQDPPAEGHLGGRRRLRRAGAPPRAAVHRELQDVRRGEQRRDPQLRSAHHVARGSRKSPKWSRTC